MVATAIPEDVAAHLEAAIQLSNRRVQMRLLHEADVLLAQNLPLAAVVIASAVLESALEAVPPERYVGHMAEIERWRTMRNTAAHCAVPKVTSEAAEAVRGIRDILAELMPSSETNRPDARITADQLRGKYKYVPTSSAAFIARKAGELDLEH